MKTIHIALLATTALFAVPAAAQTAAPAGPPKTAPADAPVTPLSPPQDGGAPADAGPTPVAQDDVSPEIVVTGSRVRGVAPVGSTVISLGREDVIASGAVTTDRLIKQIPQVFDLGVSENSRGQSGGNGNITYGNSVNLRGIGPYATSDPDRRPPRGEQQPLVRSVGHSDARASSGSKWSPTAPRPSTARTRSRAWST